jgi:hypothetical protein
MYEVPDPRSLMLLQLLHAVAAVIAPELVPQNRRVTLDHSKFHQKSQRVALGGFKRLT